MSSLKTDPARFEVVKNALYAAAEEMKIVLAKTAYSPLLKVAGDYSCGIFDVSGNMVAQGPDLPIHLGSMPDAVRAVVRAFPDPRPGDVFIHNDPYQGGSHLPDVNVVAPAFHQDRLLGYGCVRAHWPDIGSATPGSYGAVTEIYGEGLRLPPIRLYRDGKPDPSVEAIIVANVRTPAERLGDLRAQVAANHRGALRLSELAAKYGPDTLLSIMQEVLDYSETMMRAALRALPDGEAEFTDIFDGDGVIDDGCTEDAPFKVHIKVSKRGDTIAADFTGSDPAVAGPMNAPLTVTASGVFCALKMIADPNSLIPPNSGCWRPVTVTAPPGSVVNAQHPSPVVYANHEISHRVADMVMAALFAITPRTVMAGSQGTSAVITFGGIDYRNGDRFVSYEFGQGRLRRAPEQGWHQRRRQHGVQHEQHADRNPGDEFSAPRRGVFAGPRQRRRRHVSRRPGRAAGLARAGKPGPCRGVLRADGHTAVRPGRRPARRGGEAGTDRAALERPHAEQQRRFPGARRIIGGGRGARLGRLRTAGGARSGGPFRRPAGRLCYRSGSTPRLWRRTRRLTEPRPAQTDCASNEGKPDVRVTADRRPEGLVQDASGSRQDLLVVRLRQECPAAILRWIPQGDDMFANEVRSRGNRHRGVLRLQGQRQGATL